MLVYGDAARQVSATEQLARVRDAVDRAAPLPAGLQRHGCIVEALIEAGKLAQGLADREFRDAGEVDRASPQEEAALALTMAIAGRCAASWTSRFADVEMSLTTEIECCGALLQAGEIEVKEPEGYAYYLLYPECYFAAAQRLRRQRWQVLGVRSIGSSLACMVASGLAAERPITLRPVGPPFARTVAADPGRIERTATAYALVDEGPGLSGSSLAAVARWLLDAGVAEDRIHLFVAHRHGPGPEANAGIRSLWQRAAAAARVHVATFDDLILHAAAAEHRLDTWVASLVGPLQAPLREIGGGAWRDLQAHPGVDPAPVQQWQERRKFLADAGDRRWLVKFNGLGATGLRKLALAQSLGDAGFTPRPLGSRHGFIVERWCDDAVPLAVPVPANARDALLERIAAYLAFRSCSFGVPADAGASIAVLAAMARQNSTEALGPASTAPWDRWAPCLALLADGVRRIATDNRMHAWEWLVASSGVIVKTDAIDHHAGHDLVGCQDVAWDVAGAAAEFDLSESEEQRLAERVGVLAGAPVLQPLARFLRACYPAFQLGYYDGAARSASNETEALRLRAARERYADRLRRVLASAAFTPPATGWRAPG